MVDGTVRATLKIDAGPDADELELETTLHLRAGLGDLEIDSVDLVRSGLSPDRAKGNAITWGSQW